MGDPGYFRGKALDVVLLLLQKAFRDEQRHGDVLVTGLFKLGVEDMLDIFPDRIAVRAHDHAALDRGIVAQLRLFDDVGVPLGEVNLHRGDVLHHLFVVCHYFVILLNLIQTAPRAVPAKKGRLRPKA